jgi:diketogulonate reductase-like aldo/keto reductase
MLTCSFSVDNLELLLSGANVKPVVNQILLHPYVIKSTEPLLKYMKHHHIVPEGYSSLIPLTSEPGGPVDKPVKKIAKRLGVKPEQVLLAWSKAKELVPLSPKS